ncbi:MAG: B12-binding domain-containing radical SAM protein [Acutalibacteraceae bacterium]
MKNIYMVQPNSQYGNSIYFPYAAGSLVAYAFKDEDVRSEYEFKGFFYKRSDIDEAVGSLESPFFIGFSCYVWNYEYNKAFAQKVKEKFPDCYIAFGGHQVNSDSEIIGSDYVDFVTLGEGEENFRLLLLSLIKKADFEDISNMFYKKDGEIKQTGNVLTQIPHRISPYLEGYFDELVKNEKLEFSAILETNRGCPNRCAFCDWGNIKARVRLYDINIVKAEIDWMSENKIEYCYAADANFGLFPRDEEIIDYIIDKHNETGYPMKFQATYSKNNPETVFRINKKLNDAGMSKGATLSFQSMTQSVLDNIYRKNMPLESFNELMSLYSSNGIAAYSEIILGLPGESYESFRDGIEKLLESGQHMAINFFNCELLKNSIMNDPEYIKKYKIKCARTLQHQYHVIPDAKAVKEYSDIVVSTSTMSEEMWISSNILSVFVRTYHNLGLLQAVAIYLYYEKEVKYTDFYCGLIEWSKKNNETVCGRIYSWLYGKYSEILSNKGSLTCCIDEFGELTWPLEEGSFLKIILEYNKFYEEIKPFLKLWFDDEKLFDDLMSYQRSIVKTPYSENRVLELDYDFYTFFNDIYCGRPHELETKKNKISVKPGEVSHNLEEYAVKTVWYGRKGSQNIIKDITYID